MGGNHEDAQINTIYGFKKQCSDRLGASQGLQVHSAVNACFDQLPLACLIGDRVLALHGGIGDGHWSIDDLRSVKRPLDNRDLHLPKNGWLWNILWSDPIEDDRNGRTFGVHRSSRSKRAVCFGWNVTSAFCARNGIDLVVRSHQSKKQGYGFDVMHNESLVRVFSARDYEGHGNDGAVLHIAPEDPEVGSSGLLTVRAQVLHSLAKAESDE